MNYTPELNTGLINRNFSEELYEGFSHRNHLLMKDWFTVEIIVFEEVESTIQLHTWPLIIHVGKPWMSTASHSLAICTPLL